MDSPKAAPVLEIMVDCMVVVVVVGKVLAAAHWAKALAAQ
jgi:hypothetical protein